MPPLKKRKGGPGDKLGRPLGSMNIKAAPGAPKRFKSSYICFSVAHQDEVKAELAKLGRGSRVSEISKIMAAKWKALDVDERKKWDDAAKADRARYDEERANYMGPLQPAHQRRKKDPSAPKRPMSAFLFFSQKYRPQVKTEEPELKNTDVSRRLGELWRNAPEEERNHYIQEEANLRAQYKVNMAEWKKDHAKERAEARRVEREKKKMETIREKKEERQRAKEEAEEEADRSIISGGLHARDGAEGRDVHASHRSARQHVTIPDPPPPPSAAAAAGAARGSIPAGDGTEGQDDYATLHTARQQYAGGAARQYAGGAREVYGPYYGDAAGGAQELSMEAQAAAGLDFARYPHLRAAAAPGFLDGMGSPYLGAAARGSLDGSMGASPYLGAAARGSLDGMGSPYLGATHGSLDGMGSSYLRAAAHGPLDGIGSPYLRAAYAPLDGMGAGALGLGGLGRAAYLRGLGAYGGLYGSALTGGGVGLGGVLDRLQGSVDASLYGRTYGSYPTALAAQQLVGMHSAEGRNPRGEGKSSDAGGDGDGEDGEGDDARY